MPATFRMLPNNVRYAGTPGPASFVDAAKHSSARDVRRAGPLIQYILDSIRNRNGARVTCLMFHFCSRS